MYSVSNYPPGVTGNEYEIAGPDYERELDTSCPDCGGDLVQMGYRWDTWVVCAYCDYQADVAVEGRDVASTDI